MAFFSLFVFLFLSSLDFFLTQRILWIQIRRMDDITDK